MRTAAGPPPAHPETTAPTSTVAADSTSADLDPARAGLRARRRRGTRLGATTATVSLCLILAAGSDPQVATAALLPLDPHADQSTTVTPQAGEALLDATDRVIAASRSARSADRRATVEPEPEPEPEIVGSRYATVDLNVRTKPDDDAKVVAVLDFGDKVKITDVKEDGWRQVVHKGKTRWVKSAYLAKDKPKPKPSGPSTQPCADGSGVESGLTDHAVAVHRAVCAAFPSVTSYGGVRGGGGNHGTGRALDIMVSGSTGDRIAAYVRENAKRLGVSEVIWSQQIWTVQRSSEGWRGMSDRGSVTDNHYDHVHVSVY